jgi:hypothetical protein
LTRLSNLLKKLIRKVHKIQLLCSQCNGSIEPSHKLGIKGIWFEVALLYENGIPLSTLGFVTGVGVGELYFEGTEVGILLYQVYSFPLLRDIHIVLHHGFKKLAVVF